MPSSHNRRRYYEHGRQHRQHGPNADANDRVMNWDDGWRANAIASWYGPESLGTHIREGGVNHGVMYWDDGLRPDGTTSWGDPNSARIRRRDSRSMNRNWDYGEPQFYGGPLDRAPAARDQTSRHVDRDVWSSWRRWY